MGYLHVHVYASGKWEHHSLPFYHVLGKIHHSLSLQRNFCREQRGIHLPSQALRGLFPTFCFRLFLLFMSDYSVTNSTGTTQRFSTNHKTSSEEKNRSLFICNGSPAVNAKLGKTELHDQLQFCRSINFYNLYHRFR